MQKLTRYAPTRLALAAMFTALLFVAARGQGTAVRELAPGVFFWQGDHVLKQPANCTWIVFQDYVLVIDANFPGSPLAAKLTAPYFFASVADFLDQSPVMT